MSHIVFNPPPGWPTPPPGWLPPIGWSAPDGWPDPPEDWVLYLEAPSSEHAQLQHRHEQEDTHEQTWWSDGPGYHAAYYFDPPPVPTRRWALDAWPIGPSRAPKKSQNGANKKSRGFIWGRRLIYAGMAIIVITFWTSLVNTPVSRAIAACEDAVLVKATEATAPRGTNPPEVNVPSTDPLQSARYGRPEIRYTLTETGSTTTVAIAGNFLSPAGEWTTFTCTARHDVSPAQVVSVDVAPVTPPPGKTQY